MLCLKSSSLNKCQIYLYFEVQINSAIKSLVNVMCGDHLIISLFSASSLLKRELERYCYLVHSIQPQWKRNVQNTLNSLNYSLKPDRVWDLRHDDVKMKYCELRNTHSLLHESLLVLHFSLSGLGKPCWENSTHPESITGLAGESKAFWNANGGLYNCILHGVLWLCCLQCSFKARQGW